MHDHGHTDDSDDGTHHSKSHLLIMALCCTIPIVVLLVVASANVEGSYLPFLLVFLCPLMMLLMYLPRITLRKKPESRS